MGVACGPGFDGLLLRLLLAQEALLLRLRLLQLPGFLLLLRGARSMEVSGTAGGKACEA